MSVQSITHTSDRTTLPVVPFIEDVRLLPSDYEAQVRANGTVHRCPSWCRAVDHPRAAIWDWKDCGPWHTADESRVRVVMTGDVRVDVGAFTDGRLQVNCERAEGMTSAEARKLASALLNAADRMDAITTP